MTWSTQSATRGGEVLQLLSGEEGKDESVRVEEAGDPREDVGCRRIAFDGLALELGRFKRRSCSRTLCAASGVPRALSRSSRRPWQAEVHWRAAGGDMNHATVTLEVLPQPFGTFEHPDIAEGTRMQIAALNINERQRRLRLDLALRRGLTPTKGGISHIRTTTGPSGSP